MSKSNFSVADLLARAEDLLERNEFEAALKFLQRATQQEPDNVSVLDTLGELLVELGRPEEAFQIRAFALATRILYMCRSSACPCRLALSPAPRARTPFRAAPNWRQTTMPPSGCTSGNYRLARHRCRVFSAVSIF